MKINLKKARVFNDVNRLSYVVLDLTEILRKTIYSSSPDTAINRSLFERLDNEEIDLSSEEINALKVITNAGILPRIITDAISICLNEKKLTEKIGENAKMEEVAKAMVELLKE